MENRSQNKTRDMVYIAMSAVIIAVCSWISVPTVVPFTMQTFGVFAVVGLLGGRRGTLAVLIYLLLGMIGLPVFSGFTGGAACLLGTTGGYIVGFLLSALLMWAMEAVLGRKTWVLAVSMVLGLLVCYAFGTLWFVEVYARQSGPVGMWTALTWCVLPFVIPDGLKILLALLVRKRLSKVLKLDRGKENADDL